MSQETPVTPKAERLGIVQQAQSGISLPSSAPTWYSLVLKGLLKALMALAGLFFFILALQFLREGAGLYSSQIQTMLITSNTSALGFGWLLAYTFLSGSPVAAIAVTLFASHSISSMQTLLMITGSRLGASFVVLGIGFIYSLRGHERGKSVSIGILSLLTTAAIYLPALAVGLGMMQTNLLGVWQLGDIAEVPSFIKLIYGPIMDRLDMLQMPGWLIFIVGVGTMLMAFKLLDSVLPEMTSDTGAFANLQRYLAHPLAMFALGALVTSITMSVSVSLSILVPLHAKGFVRREHAVPYIMGANITTFIDTLIAALSVGGPAAFMIVLIEMVSVTLVSLLVLLTCYGPFKNGILWLQEKIAASKLSLAAFVGVIMVIPLGLMFIR